MAFDKVKYDNEYIKANYDRISLLTPKGSREKLKAEAKKHGLDSVSALVIRALEKAYGINL